MAYTLTYSYNSTSQSYSVTGYSDITTTDNVVIPSTYDDGTNGEHSVKSIGSNAFYNCSSLTSVTIPDSVTFIGWKAFSGCSGLTSVTIPDSVTRIDTYAFSDCIGLTSVIIGNGVTSIGSSAFQNCSKLTSVTIPDSVTSIGYSAFYGCSKLTSITIPDGVTRIDDSTFYNCSSLMSVNIPDGVTSIGDRAFYGCSKLTSVTIPDGVTRIGDSTFYNCSSLMSVTIGNGVKSIGGWAFQNCSKLTSVIIPNSVTSIGKAAFSRCSSLTSVTIPDSVTSIGGSAFSGCSRLTSVNIPDGVTSIGDYTFNGCSKLTSVIIPNSVTSIGNYAFWGCHGLTNVTIGNGVTSIGYETFNSCIGLTSVTIPNSVTRIGTYAFSNCKSLTSVTIPDKVTNIGNNTFYNCSSLMSVTIGNSVTSIGSNVFYGCTSLKQLILFPSTPPTLGSSAIPTTISKIYVQQSSKTAYQAATNWTTFASKIVSDDIYLSFARFNQKNKEYIEKKINNLNASLAKADSSLQKPTTTLAKESFVKVGIDGKQKFDESSYVIAPSTDGTAGQVLKKTATGTEWADESGGGGGSGAGIDTLTDVDLTSRDTTVAYDIASGVTVSSNGKFTYEGGEKEATTKVNVPIVAGKGIVMDKPADKEVVEVKVDINKAVKSDKYVNCVVIGDAAITYDGDAVAIGQSARTTYESVAVGQSAKCYNSGGVAVGQYARTGWYSVAIGQSTYAGSDNGNCIAIGSHVTTTRDNSIILGAYNEDLSAIDRFVLADGIGLSNRHNYFKITKDSSNVYHMFLDGKEVPTQAPYRHIVTLTRAENEIDEICFDFQSFKDTQANSIELLKTLLGETFSKSASGVCKVDDTTLGTVYMVTETQIKYHTTTTKGVLDISGFTITDNVVAI